jgi:hypothetical protein
LLLLLSLAHGAFASGGQMPPKHGLNCCPVACHWQFACHLVARCRWITQKLIKRQILPASKYTQAPCAQPLAPPVGSLHFQITSYVATLSPSYPTTAFGTVPDSGLNHLPKHNTNLLQALSATSSCMTPCPNVMPKRASHRTAHIPATCNMATQCASDGADKSSNCKGDVRSCALSQMQQTANTRRICKSACEGITRMHRLESSKNLW